MGRLPGRVVVAQQFNPVSVLTKMRNAVITCGEGGSTFLRTVSSALCEKAINRIPPGLAKVVLLLIVLMMRKYQKKQRHVRGRQNCTNSSIEKSRACSTDNIVSSISAV